MTFCSVIILRVRLTCVTPLLVLIGPLKRQKRRKEIVRSYLRHDCSGSCVLDENKVKESRYRMLKDLLRCAPHNNEKRRRLKLAQLDLVTPPACPVARHVP